MFDELNRRLNYIQYTLRHRKEFKRVEKELLGHNTIRCLVHDLDKVILYLILGKNLTTKIYRRFAKHHIKSAKSKNDFIEMIIDWECSRFSKSDKPLNAYGTLYKFYPELEDKILPLLKELNLIMDSQEV